MFITCPKCGYLTPETAARCKHCGTVTSGAVEASTPMAQWPPTPAEPLPAPPTSATPPPVPSPMPPPAPGTAAPGWGAVPPPMPPLVPPPVPSMFPEPGARPPRRSLPTWGIVSGALVVVIAMIVGGLAITGGDDGAQQRLDNVNAAAETQAQEVASLDASLLTRADLGTEWTETDHSGLRPNELVWDQPCSDAPGLRASAALGRGRDFAYRATSVGAEEGHLSVSVRELANTDDAEGQVAARSAPTFDPCVAAFDVEDLECACGRAGTSRGITRLAPPAGVRAVVYRDTLAYDDNGPQPAFALRAYLVGGRYLASISESRFGSPPDPTRFGELVTIVGQRLALHAPGD
jgi:hypothetical protein